MDNNKKERRQGKKIASATGAENSPNKYSSPININKAVIMIIIVEILYRSFSRDTLASQNLPNEFTPLK